MIWSGFLMDPLYGGKRAWSAWDFSGFNGTNQGNFYGEGHTTKELMVATTPTRLQAREPRRSSRRGRHRS